MQSMVYELMRAGLQFRQASAPSAVPLRFATNICLLRSARIIGQRSWLGFGSYRPFFRPLRKCVAKLLFSFFLRRKNGARRKRTRPSLANAAGR